MNQMRRTLVSMLAIGTLAGMLAACEQDGPAEELGEAVDESAEDVGEAIDEAGEEAQDAVN